MIALCVFRQMDAHRDEEFRQCGVEGRASRELRVGERLIMRRAPR
jgi:hypothetical protein